MPANNSASGKAHGDNRLSFEESFARLHEVVTKLSEGNLTLQEALSAYEEGMALSQRCSGMLEEAELRVKQVSDRAMRAGSASLANLQDTETEPANGNELIAIEIEQFETTLVFDDVPAKAQPVATSRPNGEEKSPQRPAAPPRPLHDDL